MNKIIKFLNEAYGELKKSKWLNRQEVIQSTILVGIVVALASVYVGLIDFGLTKVIGHIINKGA
ncbi:preprotein translocase subunit SecE [Elusimicrobium posterum]|uniref:preprotein translocase subunit SecE n=1 Tax=Elusimicrobium posterum TaxID=3116653 RepID=UPI003C73A137